MRKLEDLPEVEGFRFIGVCSNGNLVQCYRVRNDEGVWLIVGLSKLAQVELVGWL